MSQFNEIATELAAVGTQLYWRGWVLGTSGNFSALRAFDPLRVLITASGADKGLLEPDKHFLETDENGKVLLGEGKPSAETALHLAIYKTKLNANSILHTHSVWGTILSDIYFPNGAIKIEGYEMLKGLSGVATHEHREILPVVENSQDYNRLSKTIERVVRENPNAHGVYLRRHGLYTWGESIAEAKRHIEIFEFLFEVLGRRTTMK